MSVTTFDKLAYVDSLKAHGVSEDQARAHAAALDTALHDVVATKADIADVKGLIAESKSEILRSVFGMFLGFTTLVVVAMAALLNLHH